MQHFEVLVVGADPLQILNSACSSNILNISALQSPIARVLASFFTFAECDSFH
jgi:hypothetical protein